MNSKATFFRWQGDELLLELRIHPGAKSTGIDGIYGNRLKVRIAAPAVDGKANRQLLAYLSQIFKVRKSMIRILGGENSRNKRLIITAPQNLPDIITKNKIGETPRPSG